MNPEPFPVGTKVRFRGGDEMRARGEVHGTLGHPGMVYVRWDHGPRGWYPIEELTLTDVPVARDGQLFFEADMPTSPERRRWWREEILAGERREQRRREEGTFVC